MSAFFDYPNSAAFGRVVPKSKIYEHAGANAALKDLFVREVDQITWRYKLAPETINLNATASVPEIQVFSISLKSGKLDEAVLRAIDKAIPFPLVFELIWSGKCKVVAALKKPSEQVGMKWSSSGYFATDWIPEKVIRVPLPLALDLGVLYERILMAILPSEIFVHKAAGLDIGAYLRLIEAVRSKAREIEQIKLRINRERQFNKRVAINAELRQAKYELQSMLDDQVGMEN